MPDTTTPAHGLSAERRIDWKEVARHYRSMEQRSRRVWQQAHSNALEALIDVCGIREGEKKAAAERLSHAEAALREVRAEVKEIQRHTEGTLYMKQSIPRIGGIVERALTGAAPADGAGTLERYRARQSELAEWVEAVGECPHCGWSGSLHQDECPLAPVETCGKPYEDPFGDGVTPLLCRRAINHEGKCDD